VNITTEYKTNANGAGRIVAKGAGKQHTMAYEQDQSPNVNHGAAAGILARKVIPSAVHAKVAETVTHEDLGNGKRRFSFDL